MSEEEKPKLTIKQLEERSDRVNQLKNPFATVLADLKAAFQNDFTDEEACRYSSINKDTYYRWREESDEFCAEIDKAKDWIFSAAKELLRKAVKEGDKDTAKWLLERRKKKQYSPRTEVTGDEGGPVQTANTVTFVDGA